MSFDKKNYIKEFQKNNYDRIALNVKKGEKKKIADYAKEKGYESITEYIKMTIYRDMKENNIEKSIKDLEKEEKKLLKGFQELNKEDKEEIVKILKIKLDKIKKE